MHVALPVPAPRADRALALVCGAGAALPVVLVVGVVSFLAVESWPALAGGGWRGFFGSVWYPLEGEFGLIAMVTATLAMTAFAVLIALPLGLACALCLAFVAPPHLAVILRCALALAAGMPSVVYGFWALTALVPLVARWQPPGTSMLVAGVVLALMILPTFALLTAAALAVVPRATLAGAAALGFSCRTTLLRVALPSVRAGLAGAALLASLRALGETMAVMMVAGNVVNWPSGLFEPVRVLTANIALEMAYATGMHRAGLFVSGLMLLLTVLALAALAARVGAVRRAA